MSSYGQLDWQSVTKADSDSGVNIREIAQSHVAYTTVYR